MQLFPLVTGDMCPHVASKRLGSSDISFKLCSVIIGRGGASPAGQRCLISDLWFLLGSFKESGSLCSPANPYLSLQTDIGLPFLCPLINKAKRPRSRTRNDGSVDPRRNISQCKLCSLQLCYPPAAKTTENLAVREARC